MTVLALRLRNGTKFSHYKCAPWISQYIVLLHWQWHCLSTPGTCSSSTPGTYQARANQAQNRARTSRNRQ
eukprot:1621807-Rhodomonas_salina.2